MFEELSPAISIWRIRSTLGSTCIPTQQWLKRDWHLLSSFKDTVKPGGIQLQVFKHFLVYRGNQYRTGQCTLGLTGVPSGVGPRTTLSSSKPLSPSLTRQLNTILLGENLTNAHLVCLNQFLIDA